MDRIQWHWRVCPQACRQSEWGRRGGAPAQTGLPEVAGEEGALHQHQGGMCQPQACSQRHQSHGSFHPTWKAKPARDVSLYTSASLSRASPDSTRPGHQVAYVLTSPLVQDPPSHPQWCVLTG